MSGASTVHTQVATSPALPLHSSISEMPPGGWKLRPRPRFCLTGEMLGRIGQTTRIDWAEDLVVEFSLNPDLRP